MTFTALSNLRQIIDDGTHDPDTIYQKQLTWFVETSEPVEGAYVEYVVRPMYELFGKRVSHLEDADRQRFGKVVQWTSDHAQDSPWTGFDKFQHFVAGQYLSHEYGYWASATAGVGVEIFDEFKAKWLTFTDYVGLTENALRPHHIGFDTADADFTLQGALWADVVDDLTPEHRLSFFKAVTSSGSSYSEFFAPASNGAANAVSEDAFSLVTSSYSFDDTLAQLGLPAELNDYLKDPENDASNYVLRRTLKKFPGVTPENPQTLKQPDEALPAALLNAADKVKFVDVSTLVPSEWTTQQLAEFERKADALKQANAQLSAKEQRYQSYKAQKKQLDNAYSVVSGVGDILSVFFPNSPELDKAFRAFEVVHKIASITTALNFKQIGAMAAFGGYAAAFSLAAGLFSKRKDPNAQVYKMLNALMKQIAKLFEAIRVLRREMHERFDQLTKQMRDLSLQIAELTELIEAGNARIEDKLARIETVLARDLPKIISTQHEIIRLMYRIEENDLLSEIDGLFLTRLRHSTPVAFGDYLEKGPVNLISWVRNHGLDASHARQIGAPGAHTRLAELSISHQYKGRLLHQDGGLLAQRLADLVETDPDTGAQYFDLIDRFLLMEIIQYYNTLVAVFPEFNFAAPRNSEDVANAKDDIRELLRFIHKHQEMAQSVFFDVADISDKAALDRGFLGVLYGMLRHDINDLRSLVYREQTRLQRSNSNAEARAVDLLALTHIDSLKNPGTTWIQGPLDDPTFDETPLAVFDDPQRFERLRDLLFDDADRTGEMLETRNTEAAELLTTPEDQGALEEARFNSPLPLSLVNRLSNISCLIESDAGDEVAIKLDLGSEWLLKLPVEIALQIAEGSAVFELEIEEEQLETYNLLADIPRGIPRGGRTDRHGRTFIEP